MCELLYFSDGNVGPFFHYLYLYLFILFNIGSLSIYDILNICIYILYDILNT